MGILAVIGGTGVYDPRILDDPEEVNVTTPYGPMSALKGEYRGRQIIFMQRHGQGHSVPPHMINYRANIWGLKELEVDRILATSAVGSLRREFGPGHFLILDQFLDFTKGRKSTFFDGGQLGVVHTDVTEPYCPEIRRILGDGCAGLGIEWSDHGCYVCAEGPRFETAAEIRMFAMLGGDVVGMTGVPEIVLARELGICYSSVALVTNYGAGISESPLTHEEVVDNMKRNGERIRELIKYLIEKLPEKRNCDCGGTADRLDSGEYLWDGVAREENGGKWVDESS